MSQAAAYRRSRARSPLPSGGASWAVEGRAASRGGYIERPENRTPPASSCAGGAVAPPGVTRPLRGDLRAVAGALQVLSGREAIFMIGAVMPFRSLHQALSALTSGSTVGRRMRSPG